MLLVHFFLLCVRNKLTYSTVVISFIHSFFLPIFLFHLSQSVIMIIKIKKNLEKAILSWTNKSKCFKSVVKFSEYNMYPKICCVFISFSHRKWIFSWTFDQTKQAEHINVKVFSSSAQGKEGRKQLRVGSSLSLLYTAS